MVRGKTHATARRQRLCCMFTNGKLCGRKPLPYCKEAICDDCECRCTRHRSVAEEKRRRLCALFDQQGRNSVECPRRASDNNLTNTNEVDIEYEYGSGIGLIESSSYEEVAQTLRIPDHIRYATILWRLDGLKCLHESKCLRCRFL